MIALPTSPISNCPICNSILANSYFDFDGSEYCKQYCEKRVNHSLLFMYQNDDLITIAYTDRTLAKCLFVHWEFLSKTITVNSKPVDFWFEPEFKSRKYISDKIKNYMTMI